MLQKIQTLIGKRHSLKLLKSINVYHTQPERIVGSLSVEESVSLNNLRVVNSCSIGFLTYFGSGCEIRNANIGRYCSIGKNVTIGLHNHPINRLTTHPISFGGSLRFFNSHLYDTFKQSSPYSNSTLLVTISHDVWIGHNTIIKSGISIGTGAIIGAGSVVTKDVPSYAIVAGNPAKVLRFRFDEKLRNLLLKSLWWNYDLSSITKKTNDFTNIPKLLKELEILNQTEELKVKKHILTFNKKKFRIKINA